MVAIRPGTYQIPEIRIPWWNTQTEQLEYAVLPGREITVAAADISELSVDPLPLTAPIDSAAAPLNTTAPSWIDRSVWKLVSVVSLLGWALTLAYLWQVRRSKAPNAPKTSTAPETFAEKQVFKQLLAACADNNAARARNAIIDWTAAFRPMASPISLDEVANVFADKRFTQEIKALNVCLYSPEQTHWDGTVMAECLTRLRLAGIETGIGATEQLKLYPNGN